MWPKLNTMKHFVTLVACFASFIALAQNPNYDPDSNGDDLIGAEDLVSLLGVYNTSLAVDTTLECDFDGTAEDEWLFGVFTGDVIIDSVVIQFSITDSATYYDPGCPIPQISYLNVELEYALTNNDINEDDRIRFISSYDPPWGGGNNIAEVDFRFNGETGEAYFYWYDGLLQLLRNTAPYNSSYNFVFNTNALYSCVNAYDWRQTYSLTENGVIGGARCDGTGYDSGVYANSTGYNYFRLLPYWHYAE